MAPAKFAQCICGSIKIWPSSGGEEVIDVGYAVDAFILSGISESAFSDLSGVYYRTPETLTYNNQALPVYKSADGLNTMSFASMSNTMTNVWELRRPSSSKSAALATGDPSYSDLYPRNLSLFEGKESNQGDWWNVGSDTNFDISSVTETYSMAIKFRTTDSAASEEFNGTYVNNGNFTTYNGVRYPIYYCPDTNKYLYVRGDSGNPDSTVGYVNPGELTIRNDNSRYMLHGLSGIDSTGFIRIDWLNEASANGLYYEAEESESMNPGTVFWSTEIVGGGSSSSQNIKLQGFTGTMEIYGETTTIDEECNGVYTDTGTTNSVTYYDYDTGSYTTVTAPVYYNGARYLFLSDYQNEPVWAVGTSTSNPLYLSSSNSTNVSSIIGTNYWYYQTYRLPNQITASWTDEDQSHGGSGDEEHTYFIISGSDSTNIMTKAVNGNYVKTAFTYNYNPVFTNGHYYLYHNEYDSRFVIGTQIPSSSQEYPDASYLKYFGNGSTSLDDHWLDGTWQPVPNSYQNFTNVSGATSLNSVNMLPSQSLTFRTVGSTNTPSFEKYSRLSDWYSGSSTDAHVTISNANNPTFDGSYYYIGCYNANNSAKASQDSEYAVWQHETKPYFLIYASGANSNAWKIYGYPMINVANANSSHKAGELATVASGATVSYPASTQFEDGNTYDSFYVEYIADTSSSTYPNAFVVAGHSTDNFNGTYVKQSMTTTYNGTTYPVYYNGVYYLWHHQTSAAASLGTSSDMDSTESGMPAFYTSGGGRSVNDLTASNLTGQWSIGGGMHYESLTFTESSSTTPSAGSGEGTAPSSGTPYLHLTNSSTTTYNGYYALVSSDPTATGSKWKHTSKNFWIGWWSGGSHPGLNGGWHIYSSESNVGTENYTVQRVGTNTSSNAVEMFTGGATNNGYTITYEANGYS